MFSIAHTTHPLYKLPIQCQETDWQKLVQKGHCHEICDPFFIWPKKKSTFIKKQKLLREMFRFCENIHVHWRGASVVIDCANTTMTTYTDTFGKLGKKNVSHSTVVDDRTHDFAMENLRDNENVLEIIFVCSYWDQAEYFKQKKLFKISWHCPRWFTRWSTCNWWFLTRCLLISTTNPGDLPQ